MRTFLGLLLALGLLVGCGSDGDSEPDAADPSTSSSSEPTGDTGGEGEAGKPQLLTLVTQSDAGGEVDPQAFPLPDQAAIEDFSTRFKDPALMANALSQVLARMDVPEGMEPAGAVVAIGCDSPEDAKIKVVDDGIEVTSKPVKTDKECLVAETTVALIAADPDDL